MKALFYYFFIFGILGYTHISAQSENWKYVGPIEFPKEDSIAAKPYLSVVSKSGRLYVISSKVDDKRAHNAVYYANPGDLVFTKFIDFDKNGDSDTLAGNIGALRGIATLEGDVIITSSQPYPKTKPNTLAAAYYYKDADTNKVEKFGFNINGSGYGSFINGADISKDSMLISGIDFGTTFRWYNFGYSFKKSKRGSWNVPDTNNVSIFSNATEPGGPQSSGLDLIRDIALIPNANYFNKNTHFYTSRNSISSTQQTGGIALWKGGSSIQPIQYTPYRVSDFDGYLTFINYFPYGIAVDNSEILWVAGIDSTRRWVKGFKVEGTNAIALYDLPSQNSGDFSNPEGAPMIAPSDISFSPTNNFAYVIDRVARKAFIFQNTTVSINESDLLPSSISLDQNYPNPFNPSTMIRFYLSNTTNVKLVVSDILGRTISTLLDDILSAGTHVSTFNAKNLSNGIYFYTLITPNSSISKKMILVK